MCWEVVHLEICNSLPHHSNAWFLLICNFGFERLVRALFPLTDIQRPIRQKWFQLRSRSSSDDTLQSRLLRLSMRNLRLLLLLHSHRCSWLTLVLQVKLRWCLLLRCVLVLITMPLPSFFACVSSSAISFLRVAKFLHLPFLQLYSKPLRTLYSSFCLCSSAFSHNTTPKGKSAK